MLLVILQYLKSMVRVVEKCMFPVIGNLLIITHRLSDETFNNEDGNDNYYFYDKMIFSKSPNDEKPREIMQ